MARLVIVFLCGMMLISLKSFTQLNFSQKQDTTHHLVSLRILPLNFYSQHLGFFCRKEVQVQKATNLNVFFRLGTKEYVDYLEQKDKTLTSLKK